MAKSSAASRTKDNSSGLGMVGGAAAGAAAGSLLGPLGAAVGAVVGGVTGARAAESESANGIKTEATKIKKKLVRKAGAIIPAAKSVTASPKSKTKTKSKSKAKKVTKAK
ncbi:hypothetical protein BH11PLA2_BH11PLA2_45650 [soil metagenome]